MQFLIISQYLQIQSFTQNGKCLCITWIMDFGKNLCLLLLHYVTNPEPVIESYKLNTFSEVSIFAWLFYITDYSNTPLESWKEIQHKQKLMKNLTKSVTNITFIFYFLCHIEEMKVEMLNVCRIWAKIWWHNWLYEIYNDLLIFHRSAISFYDTYLFRVNMSIDE